MASKDRLEALQQHLSCNPTASPTEGGFTLPPSVPQHFPTLVPGPWKDCHPRFGHGLLVKDYFLEVRAHVLYGKWAQEYGPIYAMVVYEPYTKLASVRVVLSDPQEVRRILKLNPPKPPGYEDSVILGQAVLSVSDEYEWARQRELLKPAFSNPALKEIMPVLTGEVRHLMDHLKTEARAGPLDIHEVLSAAAFLMIGSSAIGEEAEFLTRRAKKLRDAFHVVTMKETVRININRDPDYQAARDEIESFTDETIARYEQSVQEGTCPAKGKDTLISIIMSKDQNGCPHMNQRQKKDGLSTFMFAG